MDEIFEKFNNILKDKDIDLKQVLGDEEKQEENQTGFSDFDIDINTIIKLKNILSKINNSNSPRNNLLNSLRPFLKDEKKQKLSQYIKIANLLSVLESMDEKENIEKNPNPDFALYVILILLIAK